MAGPELTKSLRVHAVFGNPRAGTTWLAELIAKMSGGSILFEPLNVWGGLRTDGVMPTEHEYKLAEVARLRFWYYQPIPEQASWPQARAFFTDLFAGRITPEILHARFNEYADTNRDPARAHTLVVKFCYAHLLLPWLLRHFDVRGVFLLRHPCAVVASQMRQDGWRKFVDDPRIRLPRFRHDDVLEPFHEALAAVRTPEEHMTAFWGLTARYVLEHAGTHSRLAVVRFEDLCTRRRETLAALADLLGIAFDPALVESSYEPSYTCERSRDVVARPEHLDDWRTRLTTEQIERVLAMVRRFDTPGLGLLERSTTGGPT